MKYLLLLSMIIFAANAHALDLETPGSNDINRLIGVYAKDRESLVSNEGITYPYVVKLCALENCKRMVVKAAQNWPLASVATECQESRYMIGECWFVKYGDDQGTWLERL